MTSFWSASTSVESIQNISIWCQGLRGQLPKSSVRRGWLPAGAGGHSGCPLTSWRLSKKQCSLHQCLSLGDGLGSDGCRVSWQVVPSHAWGTAEVVYDESLGRWHNKVPLFTVEMERAMCMPPGFTAMPGLSDKQRHHMIGNSFHVIVVAHIFRWWNLHQQAWDPTCGYDASNSGSGVENIGY